MRGGGASRDEPGGIAERRSAGQNHGATKYALAWLVRNAAVRTRLDQGPPPHGNRHMLLRISQETGVRAQRRMGPCRIRRRQEYQFIGPTPFFRNRDEELPGTDPKKADTDGDGMDDGIEFRGGDDPRLEALSVFAEFAAESGMLPVTAVGNFNYFGYGGGGTATLNGTNNVCLGPDRIVDAGGHRSGTETYVTLWRPNPGEIELIIDGFGPTNGLPVRIEGTLTLERGHFTSEPESVFSEYTTGSVTRTDATTLAWSIDCYPYPNLPPDSPNRGWARWRIRYEPDILKVDLDEVWFTDFTGASGIQMQDHYQDANGNNQREAGEAAGDNDIDGPEWLADGADADTNPDRQKHGLFARNAKFKVKAVFTIEDDSSFAAGDVKAWATCTAGNLALASESAPVVLVKAGAKWEGTFEITTAPATIGVLEDFTWTWHVKIKDQVTCDNNKSTHTAFVCRQAIQNEKPYDWVAGWSCRWSPGNPANDEAVLDEFIKRANLESTGMKYIFPNIHQDWSLSGLLKNLEGSCSNWLYLFEALAKVQSVTVQQRAAHLFAAVQPPWPSWAECFKTPAVKAINQPQQQWVFGDHWFAEFGGKVYDPTYATKHNGNWSAYMLTVAIDKWAIEKDAINPAGWVRCHAISAPNEVHWVDDGQGNYWGLLIDVIGDPQGQSPTIQNLSNP